MYNTRKSARTVADIELICYLVTFNTFHGNEINDRGKESKTNRNKKIDSAICT